MRVLHALGSLELHAPRPCKLFPKVSPLSSLLWVGSDYGEVVFVILSSRQRYNPFNMFKSEDIGDRLLVLEQQKKAAWHREIAQHTKVRE